MYVADDFSIIDVGLIAPLDTNPRKEYDEKAMYELTESITQHGIIQPLVVRPSKGIISGGYDLVAGERRWRCAQRAGLDVVPCVVRELSDLEVAEIQLMENIDRHQLTPMEESAGVCRIVELGVDPKKLAQKLHRAEDWVQLRLDLPTLPDAAKVALNQGKIGLGGAKQILRVDENLRHEATQKLLALDEQLTERQVSELLRSRYHEPKRRREAWQALQGEMARKFGANATPIADVELSYEYVRPWGSGVGHNVNADDEVGGMSRHPAESVVTWGELASQHGVQTYLVCAGGEININSVVEVFDKRAVMDAERALREQGKPHTLGPRKCSQESDAGSSPSEPETDDEFIVRHIMTALELHPHDELLSEALMPVLELIAERI